MSIPLQNNRPLRHAAALLLSLALCNTVYSQDSADARPAGVHAGAAVGSAAPVFREEDYRDPRFLDARYGHGHYYPPVGSVFAALPPGFVQVDSPEDDLYLAGAVWYRQQGPARYVVVMPDIGTEIQVPPRDCTSVMVGGVPYCYANNIYYVEAPDGVLVADPPVPNSAVEALPGEGAPAGGRARN